jgi:hypothetical protein
MNALISKVSGQNFTVTVSFAKDTLALMMNEGTPAADFSEGIRLIHLADTCTADEVVEALKSVFDGTAGGMQWYSSYEPCEDYRSVIFSKLGEAVEYTIYTAAGHEEHELRCAEAEAKEIRKNSY